MFCQHCPQNVLRSNSQNRNVISLLSQNLVKCISFQRTTTSKLFSCVVPVFFYCLLYHLFRLQTSPFNDSSSFEQTLSFVWTAASSREKSCYMSCQVYVMWSRHMAVESKHGVDGNEHICEIYFVVYVILFLCSSLSPKYRKKLSVGCLNTFTVKWKTSSMLLPLLELTKHGRIEKKNNFRTRKEEHVNATSILLHVKMLAAMIFVSSVSF